MKHNKPERLAFIKSLLNSQEYADIASICETFNVSNQTVRNDLTDLEKQGLCKKTYGGAVRPDTIHEETIDPYVPANKMANEIKNNLRTYYPNLFDETASLFLPGDSLLIDLFEDINIFFKANTKIYTNSLRFAAQQAKKWDFSVILLPGQIDNDLGTTTGRYMEEYLLRIPKLSTAFFFINYLDNKQKVIGFDSELYGRIAEEMIENEKVDKIILFSKPDVLEEKRSFHYVKVSRKAALFLFQAVFPDQKNRFTNLDIAEKNVLIEVGREDQNIVSMVQFPVLPQSGKRGVKQRHRK